MDTNFRDMHAEMPSANEMLGKRRAQAIPAATAMAPVPGTHEDPHLAALRQHLAPQHGEGLRGWMSRTRAQRKLDAAYGQVIDRAVAGVVAYECSRIDLTIATAQQHLRMEFIEQQTALSPRLAGTEAALVREHESLLVEIREALVIDRRRALNKVQTWHRNGDVTDDERDEYLQDFSDRYRKRSQELCVSTDELITRVKAKLISE